MEEYEQKKYYDNPDYPEVQVVFKTFVCRKDPPPPELLLAFKNLRDDKTVYGTIYVVNLLYSSSSSFVSTFALFLKPSVASE
jgi:hypothetical protein